MYIRSDSIRDMILCVFVEKYEEAWKKENMKHVVCLYENYKQTDARDMYIQLLLYLKLFLNCIT